MALPLCSPSAAAVKPPDMTACAAGGGQRWVPCALACTPNILGWRRPAQVSPASAPPAAADTCSKLTCQQKKQAARRTHQESGAAYVHMPNAHIGAVCSTWLCLHLRLPEGGQQHSGARGVAVLPGRPAFAQQPPSSNRSTSSSRLSATRWLVVHHSVMCQ